MIRLPQNLEFRIRSGFGWFVCFDDEQKPQWEPHDADAAHVHRYPTIILASIDATHIWYGGITVMIEFVDAGEVIPPTIPFPAPRPADAA